MADIAQFGIGLDASGAVASINSLGTAAERAATSSDKLDASTRRIRQSADGLTASQRDLVQRMQAVADAAQMVDRANLDGVATIRAQVDELRQLATAMGQVGIVEQGLTEITKRFTVAEETKTVAMSGGLAGMGRIRMGLTSLIAQYTGSIPVLDRIGASFLTMGVGGTVAIAVIAGLAAIAAAYHFATKAASELADTQDKATASLKHMQEQQQAGVGGQTALDVKNARDKLNTMGAALAVQDARVDSFNPVSEGHRIAAAIADTMRKSYNEQAAIVAFGESQLAAIRKKAGNDTIAETVRDTAAAIEAGQATAGQIRNAQLMVTGLNQTIAALRGNSSKLPELTDTIALRDTLQSALHPEVKTRRDPDVAKLAAEARTREDIAAQEERRVAAARALDAAASQGQAAYEREAHTQALLNQELEVEKRIRDSFKDTAGNQRAGTQEAMDSEIARARAAIQSQDELGQHTRATLDVEKNAGVIAVLDAKVAAYQQVGGAVKDAAVETEYLDRVAKANAVTDTAQRQILLDQAAAIRDKTMALHASEAALTAEQLATRAAADEQRRQLQQVDQLFRSTFSTLFGDIFTKGTNMFTALFDAIRQGLIKLVSDLAAGQFTDKLVGAFGAGIGAMLLPHSALAQGNGPAIPWGALGAGDTAPGYSRAATAGGYTGVALGAGIAGYGVGQSVYSTSHDSAGNYLRGGVGGALGGAATGAAIGMAIGPVGAAAGAVVGSIAGLVGGILGIGSASRAAAKQMAEAQAAVKLSMDALRATVNNDSVAQGVAQINADREERRKAIEDAYQGGGADSDQVRNRNAALAEMNRLEDERIKQLQDEAALQKREFAEDLRVRLLRAQGHTAEADALALQLQQQRERDALIKSFGDTIDPTEAATLALLDQVQAQEKLTGAITATNSAALNMVEGYKVQAAVFGAMTSRTAAGAPRGPAGPTTSASAASTGGDLTVSLVMPSGEKLGKVVIKDFQNRKRRGDATLGTLLA